MSGSQTAANAISIAGAIRSGIIAAVEVTAEVGGGELGPLAYALEATGAAVFGTGDGLARAVRHDFKEDLKVDFKAYNLSMHCQNPARR